MKDTRFFPHWWTLTLRGVLLVIMGLVVFRYPVEALVGFAVYLGIFLVAEGIITLALVFKRKESHSAVVRVWSE